MKDINATSPISLKTDQPGKENAAQLKKAVVNFEALFINQMLKEMRNTISKSGFLHGAPGEDIYTSLFDAELSKLMASSGGIGLENTLLKQLTLEFNGNESLPKLLNQANDKKSSVDAGVTGDSGDKTAEKNLLGLQKFKFPLHGKVSSGYGFRKDPFTGDTRFHHGLDIAALEGSPVHPASGGKVIFSGEKQGYGNIVEIMHGNGYVTRYAHNMENIVKQGDMVNTSDLIAYVGSTGRSTGPHLHFEVIKDGVSIDPRTLPYG